MVDELSVYAGTAPVIDGNIEAAEWEDAYSFDASDFWGSYDSTPQPVGSVTGYLKMDEEQNWLYGAFINYNDPILEDHDEVALYIDDNGDGTYPPVDVVTEGNYWAVYYAAGNELRFRPIYETGSVGDVVYLEDPQVEASDAEGYVTFEFAIPFGDEDWEINPGVDNNSTIGIFVLDDNTPDPHGFDSWWPHDNLNIFDPAGYGVIQYAAEIQTPQPPANLNLTALEDHVFQLDWDMPQMNDFSHFNIYFALNDEQFEMIDTSQGTCWLYEYEFFPQTSYSFYLTTVNNSGSESDASQIVEYLTTDEVPDEIPLVTRLIGNYPNPFNPDTTIRFSIAENNSRTVINLYNIKGQMVKTLVDEVLPAGYHQITWNGCTNSGKQTASGFYLLQMQSGSFSCVKKLILLK
jgi:hypothetical protein